MSSHQLETEVCWSHVLKTKIDNILYECHDTMNSGHLSENRTVERVEQTTW